MLFDPVNGTAYNIAAHFMATNIAIKIMEPILALGFIFHIVYGIIVQLNNWKARGNDSYAIVDQKESSTWSARNMIYLGLVVWAFLILHIINFYWKIKYTGGLETVTINGVQMHNTFKLVTDLFQYWWYDALYIIGFIALGLHLHHAFWSSLHTLGWNNKKWRRRLEVIGDIYAYVITIGFTIIPLYFYIFK
jgi:succinate dehydrogenase / fumarate reductase cytochrome b subunit